jgi:Protein of unknown function (DUF2585)
MGVKSFGGIRNMAWPLRINKFGALIALLLFLAFGAILSNMGRPPICACGTVKLWHGIVQSAENSQHIADWYTLSHIIHGFLFYGAGHLLRSKWPKIFPLGVIVCLAILVEGAWEVVENSPIIIDRYREATMSYGYEGDSIINSMADIFWMLFGFLLASRLSWKVTFAMAIAFELLTAYLIRDNLALNILMLTTPIEAVKEWQAAGTGYWLTGRS